MSQGLFAVLLTIAAVATFIITTLIEKRVNGKSNPEFFPARLYIGIAAATVLISFSAFLMPERQSDIINRASEVRAINSFMPGKMTADEFAFRIIDEDKKMMIIDLRTKELYSQMNFPNSINLNMENLFGKDGAKTFSGKNTDYVFIADTEELEIKAAFIATELGYEKVFILSEGLNGFRDKIINFRMPEKIFTRQDADTYRFREKAGKLIPEILKANKEKGTKQKNKSKRVLGGC